MQSLSASWYLNQGFRIIPTQPSRPKWVVEGYRKDSICTLADFQNGRGVKLVTGKQPNGYYLVGVDDDEDGNWIGKLANELPDIYRQLVIANSTDGDGLHAFFLTSEA